MSPDRDALRATVFDVLLSIAPEVDPAGIDPARPLRHQVDLDSMDWLNVLIALHARLGVEVTETDAARLHTLQQLLDHLAARLPAPGG